MSSPQLDTPQRGFSFREDGPLDMRMDNSVGVSAAQWLNEAPEADIARVIRELGEERFARRIARSIVQARPLSGTVQLAEVVAAAVPGGHRPQARHPATRTFQAIRMFVNAELDELRAGLSAAFDVLCEGGRLAVISFHSLEDRIVKRAFRAWCKPPALPRRLPVRHVEAQVPARHVTGPLRPGAPEIRNNPRARSAVLRVIEKTVAAPG